MCTKQPVIDYSNIFAFIHYNINEQIKNKLCTSFSNVCTEFFIIFYGAKKKNLG